MKTEIKEALDKLELLTSKMDVPSFKQRNPIWLKKNLASRNKEHKNYNEVMKMVDFLLSHGVGHG